MRTHTRVATAGAALLALTTALVGCSPTSPSSTSSSSSGAPTSGSTPGDSTSPSTEPTVTVTVTDTPTPKPSWPTTLPECGAGIPLPLSEADSPPSATTQVVTASTKSVSLYTTTDDTSRVLLKKVGGPPVFRSSGTVTVTKVRVASDAVHWWGQDSLLQTSVAAGGKTEFLRLPDALLAQSWDANGNRLAYLVHRNTKKVALPSVLCLYNAKTGKVKKLAEMIGTPLGREGMLTDDWSVSWSPNGSAIAAVDTLAYPEPSLQVVNVKGKSLVPPMSATFAHWLPDGRLLLAMLSPQPVAYFALNVSSGTKDSIALPSGALWPAVSPDGNLVAFNLASGSSKPIAKVMNLTTGDITKLGGNLVNPIWISPTEVALTVTKACPQYSLCPLGADVTDKTAAVDVTTLTKRPLQLVSTIADQTSIQVGADVRLPD